VRALKPGPEDVSYDIRSGVGRILCVMALHRLRRCVGVGLSVPLCQIARPNTLKLRGRKAPLEIVCGDAATAYPADGTIYCMLNPFAAVSEELLRDVAVARDEAVARAVSETFGCQLDGNRKTTRSRTRVRVVYCCCQKCQKGNSG
jgi:hypothetical protein